MAAIEGLADTPRSPVFACASTARQRYTAATSTVNPASEVEQMLPRGVVPKGFQAWGGATVLAGSAVSGALIDVRRTTNGSRATTDGCLNPDTDLDRIARL